jgi:tRNA threonylcarbamoyladenosine biosynthesis protein TsaE
LLGLREVDIGHTDLGESERASPAVELPRNFCDCIRDASTLSHPPILETRSLHWPDEVACARFASALAHAIAREPQLQDARLELDGPLGAGKTTFVRHLLRGLGASGRIKSPTYAVVEPYALSLSNGQVLHVSHFDFYRFDDPREWDDAGFRDLYAAPGLKIAEWAAKAAPQLPAPDLVLTIDPQADDSRTVQAEAFSAAGHALLAAAEGAA